MVPPCFLLLIYLINPVFGSWSSWSSIRGCYNKDMFGPKVNKHKRTCSGSCPTGTNSIQFGYACHEGYTAPYIIKDDGTRPNCGGPFICKATYNFDVQFHLNFHLMNFPTSNLDIIVASNKDVSGDAEIKIESVNHVDDSNLNLAYTKNPFDFTATHFVADRYRAQTTTFGFNSVVVDGNRLKIKATGKITSNSQPSSQAVLSAGFHFQNSNMDADEANETIIILQNKRERAGSSLKGSSDIINKGASELSGAPAMILRPGFVYPSSTEIGATGENQIYDLTHRVYIPKLQFNIHTNIYCDMASGYSPEKLTMWTNTEKSQHVLQVSTLFAQGEGILTKHKMVDIDNEYFTNTYIVTKPARRLHYDRVWCDRPLNDCSASNTFTTVTNTWSKEFPLYKEESQTEPYVPYRIKQLQSGLCWEFKDNVIILSSKCRDRFHFNYKLEIFHSETGKQLYLHGNGWKTTPSSAGFFNKEHGSYTAIIAGWRFGKCFMEGNYGHTATGIKYQSSLKCTANNTQILYRPDLSEHYNKINMKNLVQVTHNSQPIMVVCEPTKFLSKRSNCRYSSDKGAKWTGTPTVLSQIMFYLPSSSLFYGHCLQAKHYCTFDLDKMRTTYIEETEYTDKLSDLSMVSATGLDDMSLTYDAEESNEDPSIGLSAKGLFTSNGGTWTKMYHWMN
ncbi:uncharacterized protein [Clytia hemisphaerica]|uniref:Cnidarian restricted protein n=1 Tax=Clytia hemisphaerica TaxID=252671 RepID=A0A7M5XI01_9CNID